MDIVQIRSVERPACFPPVVLGGLLTGVENVAWSV